MERLAQYSISEFSMKFLENSTKPEIEKKVDTFSKILIFRISKESTLKISDHNQLMRSMKFDVLDTIYFFNLTKM